MATMLITSTFGSDDPTRATLAFLYALGAVEAGHEPQISLQGEATNLMKDSIANAVHGVGWPPLSELLPKVIGHGIPIHIWGGCAKARAVSESDLEGKNAKFITPKIWAELVVASDKNVSV